MEITDSARNRMFSNKDLVRLIINTITLSTNETPDTASSPTFAVMIESASPTVTVSICSMINGMINLFSALATGLLSYMP